MSKKNHSLPKFGAWLLEKIISRDVRYSAQGDFEEFYRDLAQDRGVLRARFMLWKQILVSIPSFISDSIYWSAIMFKNYFKTAIRNMKRQKLYSFINIAGLSVGLACCILIVLYIHFELSYDRYHQNADRIYRVIEMSKEEGKTDYSATTPAPLAPALAAEFPEVKQAVRFFHPSWIEKWRISVEDKIFFEENVFFTDPQALEVFSFPLVQGNSSDALREPNTAVINEDMAQKYFGNSNPLGKTFILNSTEMKITGIAQNIPPNSHFRSDFLVSFSTLGHPSFRNFVYDMLTDWRSHNFYTYLLLGEGNSYLGLQNKFVPFLEKHFNTKISNSGIYLQPLKDIHLNSKNFSYEITSTNSDIAYVYIFSAIALFVLIIACINYMNLTTARSANRAKEVGTRKVVGASRLQLVQQFLGESVALLLIALLFALILVSFFLPTLNSLTDSSFKIDFKNLTSIAGLMLSAALVLGVAAGIYPALFLSTFHPLNILKGNIYSGLKRIQFRRLLVVVQFAISIVLIIGTMVIRNQLQYCLNKNLGFDKEHLVVIPVRESKTIIEFNSLRNKLLQHPEIMNVASSSSLPGKTIGTRGFLPEGNEWNPRFSMFVDYDFIPTMGMEIVEGRNFSKEFSTDLDDAYIINEAAAKEFGWDSAVGKSLFWRGDKNRKGEVIGVVKDFHFMSLHQKIEPFILHLLQPGQGFGYITIKVNTQNIFNLLNTIRKDWQEFNPRAPFEIFFLDENLNRLYVSEKRMLKVSEIFASLAILIACLGLFGLASYVAEQRTKEIGIRKALGASTGSIIILLSKEFTKLVVISNVLAWPIAYYTMNKWLQDFAYRVSIGVQTFLLAGALAFVIALFSVGYQSVRSALANPVKALRYE